ncbi:uncharacterized protein AB9W97_008097 isoform 1-T5 [Spinachia spinachia]
MESSLRLTVLLLLVTGAVTVEDLNHEAAAQRAKRWSGLSVFNSLRGKVRPTQPAPTMAPAGGDFNLADAFHPDGVGFNLEDAVQPAQKLLDNPSGESCHRGLLEKLNDVIENQKQQLRLLKMLTPSSRFYNQNMH